MFGIKQIRNLTLITVITLLFIVYLSPIHIYSQESLKITEFRITHTSLTKDGIQINYTINTNNDADIVSWLVTRTLIEPSGSSAWSGTKPGQITLNVQSGSIILYAWVKNSLGEISRPVSANTTICPMPVRTIEEFKSVGTSNFRFKDKYGNVNFPIADLLIVAGGGGGGGGGSGESETQWDGSNTCEEGSGGGGGGAGQLLSEPAYSLDPFKHYRICIGNGGDSGRGGGKHYSGHDADNGDPSYFLDADLSTYILYAHQGHGGEGGKNKGGDSWGDGGSGYPGGHNNHGTGSGGDGGDNGRGHGHADNGSAPDNSGGGGGGGEGSNCHSSGHEGGDGGSGYMSIYWKGILNQ